MGSLLFNGFKLIYIHKKPLCRQNFIGYHTHLSLIGRAFITLAQKIGLITLSFSFFLKKKHDIKF